MLRVSGARVTDAKCDSHGCGVTIAAGSVLTEVVIDQSLDACRTITVEELTQALGGVPSDKADGPALSVAALRNAIQS